MKPLSVARLNKMFATPPDPKRVSEACFKTYTKLKPLTVDYIIKKHDEFNLPEIKLPLDGYFVDKFIDGHGAKIEG